MGESLRDAQRAQQVVHAFFGLPGLQHGGDRSLAIVDILPALKGEDSYGVTHGSLHTRSLRRVPASQGLRLGSLQNPHV